MSRCPYIYDSRSPENFKTVSVKVWAYLDGVENPVLETVEVHEGEENNEEAIRDQLGRNVEKFEIIN